MTDDGVEAKFKEWLEKFRFYRDPPTEKKLREWFAYFNTIDTPVAAKVLDHVMVVSERDIQSGYKACLEGLEGWSSDPSKRQGDWYFVGFGKPGESGPAMLRPFRHANNLAYDRFDPLFHNLRDLPGLKLTARDHVVFVDDFSGSGRQVTRMWPRVTELVASEATCHLILTAITTTAQSAIAEKTELRVSASILLGPEIAVFHEDNTSFTADEKAVIERYCEKADPQNPRGFGKLGVLFVLSHTIPNNSLPILHVDKQDWRGLFPRYLKPGGDGGSV
jgi:hypothetical protein